MARYQYGANDARRKKRVKDKKIVIYREGRQELNIFYVPVHPGKLWAYYRQLSGDELHKAAQDVREEDALFEVNYRPDYGEWDAIGYNGMVYNISRVDDFEGYKGVLTVYAKLIPRQHQPEPGQMRDYGEYSKGI